ncbi:TetR/AcrR family transcriptional regulator [Lactococcus insecticola]|uniref:TetR family transcriptional regulator n=1 Tax=Pseudolactococcus insecticola TaxID=2709158 RepID=A0A6A0B704_9LACT|nr:TetR/AcrR family transcriptional regulator [Lactococcus insecticola]GFH40084.1 TetR family transcriptional regulator [Lactococcus insecticola]
MTSTRKRGEALEEEIFRAARDILATKGIEQATFSAIAKQAKTSRTVLYRRFNSPFELLMTAKLAEVTDALGVFSDILIDTGSMRGDLLLVFNRFLQSSQILGRELMQAMTIEISKGNPVIEKQILAVKTGNLAIMNKIIENAQARGEDVLEVSDYAKLIPFELVRYEIIVNKHEITTTFLEQLIDEVVLKLLRRED